MQKVEGSSPFSRSPKAPQIAGFFVARQGASDRHAPLYNNSVQQTAFLPVSSAHEMRSDARSRTARTAQSAIVAAVRAAWRRHQLKHARRLCRAASHDRLRGERAVSSPMRAAARRLPGHLHSCSRVYSALTVSAWPPVSDSGRCQRAGCCWQMARLAAEQPHGVLVGAGRDARFATDQRAGDGRSSSRVAGWVIPLSRRSLAECCNGVLRARGVCTRGPPAGGTGAVCPERQLGVGRELDVAGWLSGHGRHVPVGSCDLGHAVDFVPWSVILGIPGRGLVRSGNGGVVFELGIGGNPGVLHRHRSQLRCVLRGGRRASCRGCRGCADASSR